MRILHRGSGVLLHITSLPSPWGIGDFGPEAYKFADFLSEAGQGYWQILPLTPVDPDYSNSPYHSTSAMALNSTLLSPEIFIQQGLLKKSEVPHTGKKLPKYVDYKRVAAFKKNLFEIAWKRFKKNKNWSDFEIFCGQNSSWLDDYALFETFEAHFAGSPWNEWPDEIRDRKPGALDALQNKLLDRVKMSRFLQFKCLEQWDSLKAYCREKNIQIIGDIPIYVDYDSTDLWVHPELFQLDANKRPCAVAGVPPDYFSRTGQLWGNPLYRWDYLKEKKFDWWIRRMEYNLGLYDRVRMDHFRGFVGYWEVPASEKTAINGKWVEAPAEDFFNQLKDHFPSLPIIAEDLGTITPDVRKVIRHFGFPGMKVLLFAFGEDNPSHPYLPHNYERNCVVYTGTHDNNTVRGWFENEASAEEKRRLFRYLGKTVPLDKIPWEFIRLGMMSVADTFIVPMQDLLGLGEKARMNRPSTSKGNWRWRMSRTSPSASLAGKLREITEFYGRT